MKAQDLIYKGMVIKMAWITTELLNTKDTWGNKLIVKNSDGKIILTIINVWGDKEIIKTLDELLEEGK